MPLRLDALQLLYRDEGQKASSSSSSSSSLLWLSHVPSFGLEARKFENEEAFLPVKNQITDCSDCSAWVHCRGSS